jgi:hypothetical protein
VTRAIVRSPLVLDGRWTFEGTSIAIAQIRYDLGRMSRDDVLRSYRFMDLTECEIDMVAAFPFEPVRDLTLSVTTAAVTVHCLCGEDTPVVITDTKHVAICICGRDWDLETTISILPVTADNGTVASPT